MNHPTPDPFSNVIPNLQIAWDPTSLRALQFCPRSYQYSILQGWRGPSSSDLEFGRYFAEATEVYKRARLAGRSKLDATIDAVLHTVNATWLPEEEHLAEGTDNETVYVPAHPWGGRYEKSWRCTGTHPYRNSKGNRAKCPWSHKGAWFPPPAPDICGVCGSSVETERRWVSNDPAKDRYTLIRAVVWWCDDQAERLEDGPVTYAFPDGTPAVELSIPITLPWQAPSQERYILTGYLDSIEELGEERFITDNKTTKKALNKQYWKQYSPNVQVSTYDLIGSVLFPDLNLRGVRIDAVQTLVGGARFGTQVFYRSDKQREEYLQDIEYTIREAEHYAKDNYWPKREANCAICQFNAVCSKEPAERERYLKGNFEVRKWNPLRER